MRLTCATCGETDYQIGRVIMRSGKEHLQARCRSCGNIFDPASPFIPKNGMSINSLPVFENYVKLAPPCEHCGSTGGTELHHYAPVSIFGRRDADTWATEYLCDKCHRTWHTKTRLAI